MIRSVEQAKLELECNEKAQKAALQNEKAELRARAEQKKYEDWLKKLDKQSKVWLN
jgi:predicted acetyltransferase